MSRPRLRNTVGVLTHPDSIAQARAGAWLPQELQAWRTQVQLGVEHLARQVEREGDAYQAGAMPLAEYRHRRQALDERLHALYAVAPHRCSLTATVASA